MQIEEIIIGVVIGNFFSYLLRQLFFRLDIWNRLGRFLRPKLIEDENIARTITGAIQADVEDYTGIKMTHMIKGVVEQRRGNFCFFDLNGFFHKVPVNKCAIYCNDGTVHGRIDLYETYLNF